MNCNIVKDLIPLYIDECCSEESSEAVKEHIALCPECKVFYENGIFCRDKISEVADVEMAAFLDFERLSKPCRVNIWKASILQSLLLLASFLIMTAGVAMEAFTPEGLDNGYWAATLVAPVGGFMLSLVNWYFVRAYRNKKLFSNTSLGASLGCMSCAYIWVFLHYDFSSKYFGDYFAVGALVVVICCMCSKILSGYYAKLLGKE